MRCPLVILAILLIGGCATSSPTQRWEEALAAEVEEGRAEAEQRRQQFSEERIARIERYGWPPDITRSVINHQIRVGMVDVMVREAWGEPTVINRTTRADGDSEQWVYRDRDSYVYLENGRVTAIQSSR
jgi:hypothetical protein